MHDAIANLLEVGVDLLVRDGSYPYILDWRVKTMDSLGGAHLQAYSTPTGKEQGLSALDYAAMNHDPFMFEHLHKTGKNVDINYVDEEGFTVVHRLISSTPLMLAMMEDEPHVELIRALLEAGANPFIANENGGTALGCVGEHQCPQYLSVEGGAARPCLRAEGGSHIALVQGQHLLQRLLGKYAVDGGRRVSVVPICGHSAFPRSRF